MENKQQGISTRHHYLPQFYLKGFTDESETLAIYDCVKRTVSPRRFLPKAKFFDGRNLVDFLGERTDIPEQMYSAMDTRHADLFKQIQKQNDTLELQEDDLDLLQEFILTLFWRLPSNETVYNERYFDIPNFTKHFKIFKESTGEVDEEMTKSVISNKAFIKTMKPFIGITQLAYRFTKDYTNWRFLYNPLGNNICSDNPIIFRKKSIEIFDEEFIIPLSKHHTLIKTFREGNPRELPAETMYCLNLLSFLHGEIYCCCPERETLDNIYKASTNFLQRPEFLAELKELFFKDMRGEE